MQISTQMDEPAADALGGMGHAEWEMNSLFHRSARLLPLNNITDLLSLNEILVEICNNICNEPTNTKYHKIRLGNKTMQTRIFAKQGGLEFLSAIGFRTGTIGGEKHLILDSPVMRADGKVVSAADTVKNGGIVTTVFESITSSSSSNAVINVDAERVRVGLKWLEETIATCATMHGLTGSGEKTDDTTACAETCIQIRLPGGQLVQGGFMREDTVDDILEFARCFFRYEKYSEIVLRLPYNATTIMNDNPMLTIDQAKLHPRAMLVASTEKTFAIRSSTMSNTHEKIKENQKNRLAAAVQAKELKLAAQEKERLHREGVLLSFKDDREDVKKKKR